MNKTVLTSFTILCLLSTVFLIGFKISVKASPDIIYVPTDYPTIQEAINNANKGDTIFVYNGTYYEHVVVNKTVSLVGENRLSTIDGNNTGIGFNVTASNVDIVGFTVRNCGSVLNPNFPDSGIVLHNTINGLIDNNNIVNNWFGILLINSHDNKITNNDVSMNGNNVDLRYSNGNILTNNHITSSSVGIGFYQCVSGSNVVIYNDITNNDAGISLLGDSRDQILHHNSIIANSQPVKSQPSHSNTWDNGYPSGGNYWSDYNGTDLLLGFYQNEIGSDGIGDVPYIINSNNIDNYPLMGTFSSFKTSLGDDVNVVSNSTIDDFEYIEHNSTITMRVSNMTTNQTYGFCRVTIPRSLMGGPYVAMVNGELIDSTELPISNSTHAFLYFTYVHSTHKVTIVPNWVYLYYDLLDKYTNLLSKYNLLNQTCQRLLGNITSLQGQIELLNSTCNNLQTSINDLEGQIELLNSTLQEQINSLNSTCKDLQESIDDLMIMFNSTSDNLQKQIDSLNSTLQMSIDDLQEQVNLLNSTLQTSVNELQTSFNELQEQYNSLNSTLTSNQEAIMNELSTIRILMYVFVASIAILIGTTIYFAKRKPRTRPKEKRKKRKTKTKKKS